MTVNLQTPVQYLKGVGPRAAMLLKKLGVLTVEDLIYFFPRDYDDRTQVALISELTSADYQVIRGEIIDIRQQLTRNHFSVLKLKIADHSGSIQAVSFNQPYLARLFRPGMKLIISGKLEFSSFEGINQFIVRDYEIDTGVNPKIVPLYPLTKGLFPKKLRNIAKTALDNCLADIEEWLPEELRLKHKLCGLCEAIEHLHFPAKLSQTVPARRRLAFDDFFIFQLGLGLRQSRIKAEAGISYNIDQRMLNDLQEALPFKLTSAQERVLKEIQADMQSNHPMNRLLQGDVGSGKTIIAALSSLLAIHNGYQVALMAPTEILAQQHYDKIIRLPGYQKIRVGLLTGATRKNKQVEKLDKHDLIIGTHALIQDKVNFEKLGLVIIDEQHRFGVQQRAQLVKKGVNPDFLVMTATPIPRSLALTLYGDLDRSVIDELPPGRTPVKTYFVPEDKRRGAYEFMRQQIKAGRQVFIVCPLVEESSKVDLKAALDEAERLQRDIFPELTVGLLHGRLKSEAKDQVMKQFKDGQIQILVSTTVIEVGIDIPNATVMVVEHAERFGLSQLHQLRGRIGRGAKQSHCFLLADAKSQESRARIKAMIDSTDGFQLAEVDLKLRGPGDFYGIRQSGLPNFRVADIIMDEKILREARKAAFDLIEEDVNSARNIWQSQGQKVKGAVAGATLN
ncbi:MAG: ATP-dependent DNA helicase RecG [Candidatus Margulisbacteria bacterium]|nr:ATP-dependent DNA helicase RecG [Candidatus Margulisiibacteriota bacterium]